MRKLTVPSCATTLLASLFCASVAIAAPPVHMASGGGTVDDAGARNTHGFTAQIDAAGNVRGQAEFQLRYLDLTIHVEITCLAVVGNDAWLGGTITTSSDPALVGQQVLFRVQDNGEGGAAPPDMTSQIVIGVVVPPCTTTGSRAGGLGASAACIPPPAARFLPCA